MAQKWLVPKHPPAFHGTTVKRLYEQWNGNFLESEEMSVKSDTTMRTHIQHITEEIHDHHLELCLKKKLIPVMVLQVEENLLQVMWGRKKKKIILHSTSDLIHQKKTFLVDTVPAGGNRTVFLYCKSLTDF